MSARLALWVLWTALSLCLPAAARLELCLCDGPRGLLDGAACGMAVEEEAQACCCAPDGDGEPRLETRGQRDGCECVSLDVQRSEPVAHAAVVPATPLRADCDRVARVAAPVLTSVRCARVQRTWVRPRAGDGLPLRI